MCYETMTMYDLALMQYDELDAAFLTYLVNSKKKGSHADRIFQMLRSLTLIILARHSNDEFRTIWWDRRG